MSLNSVSGTVGEDQYAEAENVVCPRFFASAFTRPAIQAIGSHKSSHAIQAQLRTFVGQIFVHTRGTDHAPAVFVNLAHTPQQALIGLLTGTGRSIQPSVETAG